MLCGEALSLLYFTGNFRDALVVITLRPPGNNSAQQNRILRRQRPALTRESVVAIER